MTMAVRTCLTCANTSSTATRPGRSSSSSAGEIDGTHLLGRRAGDGDGDRRLALGRTDQGDDTIWHLLLEFLGDGPQVLPTDPVQDPGQELGASDLFNLPAALAAPTHGELALGLGKVLLELFALGLQGLDPGQDLGHRRAELFG
jgi:hypothetical protein